MPSPLFNQDFIIEGEYYGSAPREKSSSRAFWVPENSLSFSCPACGRQWAQVVTHAQDGGICRWLHYTFNCEKCPPEPGWWAPAGSLWFPAMPELIRSFPHRVLLREFALHVKEFYENDQHRESPALAAAL